MSSTVKGLTLAAAGAALLLSYAAVAVELPEGPNRDVVVRACGACHDLEMVFDAAGQDREGWNGTIEEMTGYGMKLSPQEREQMLEYFTRALGPEARRPR